ncbi:MAG: NUDIX hydrolase [Gammaproteobacteria bacterium]|nr:NUDIX hydrolase [Gammaproteobacteria bacterium]
MSQFKPRVTVSAVIERDGRFVFVEEAVRGKMRINQPAGHLEENESLVDAVRREVHEETGCHFEPEGITGIYLWQTPPKPGKPTLTFLRVNFFGHCVDEDDEPELDDGIERVLWLTPEELHAGADNGDWRLRSPMVTRCIEDYLGGRHFPLEAIADLLPGRN